MSAGVGLSAGATPHGYGDMSERRITRRDPIGVGHATRLRPTPTPIAAAPRPSPAAGWMPAAEGNFEDELDEIADQVTARPGGPAARARGSVAAPASP